MARILQACEAPTLHAEGWSIRHGATSREAAIQPGIGGTPQGNRSEYSIRVLENPLFYPALLSLDLTNAPAAAAIAPINEHWGRFHLQGEGFQRTDNLRVFGMRLGAVPIFHICQNDITLTGSIAVGVVLINGAGTQLVVNASNAWNTADVFLIEWHVKLDGVNGIFELWIDGVLQISYIGALVGPGGELTMDTVMLGGGYYDGITQDVGVATALTNNRYRFDDLVINDATGTINNSRVGDGYVIRLSPTDNGAFSQLKNSNGTSVNNYRHASRGAERSTVGPTAPGQRDSYVVSRLDPEWGGVNAVRFDGVASSNGASINKLRFSMKPAGQADFQLAAADTIPPEATTDRDADSPWVSQIVELNPNTGLGFTAAEFDGAEAGFAFEA